MSCGNRLCIRGNQTACRMSSEMKLSAAVSPTINLSSLTSVQSITAMNSSTTYIHFCAKRRAIHQPNAVLTVTLYFFIVRHYCVLPSWPCFSLNHLLCLGEGVRITPSSVFASLKKLVRSWANLFCDISRIL